MPKNATHKNEKAFTLIEFILYIALLSIFLSGAIMFAWDVIYGRVKSSVQQEVSENMRLATQKISYEIQNAQGINSVTNTSISLQMSDSSRNPTVIDLSEGRLRIGFGSSGACPSSAPCEITSNKVTVSNLTFTDFSTGDDSSKNIGYTITIDYNNPQNRKEWEKSMTITSADELRSN